MPENYSEEDNDWMTKELEKQFITIIKKADNKSSQELKNDEASMLFYWVRHRDEKIFAGVNKAVGYGVKKTRHYVRKKKAAK